MTPIVQLVRNDIGPTLQRYSTEMKKGMGETVKIAAKGVTRFIIDNTPPNSAAGRGRDGLNAGRVKIARQMNSVLAPIKLKGQRQITTVFGRKLKRPISVPTRERYPDVAGTYRANMRVAASGIGLRATPGHKFYVDVRKFQNVLAAKQAAVGTLAAGWMAGAAALDVPVQAWIARHGASGGRVQIATQGDRMIVVVENFGEGLPPDLRSELARRVEAAVGYQRDTMIRGINGYHNRIRQQLQINGRDRAA